MCGIALEEGGGENKEMLTFLGWKVKNNAQTRSFSFQI